MKITLSFTDANPHQDGVVTLLVSVDSYGIVHGQRVYSESVGSGKKMSKSSSERLPVAVEEALAFCEMQQKNALLVVDPAGKFDMGLIARFYKA